MPMGCGRCHWLADGSKWFRNSRIPNGREPGPYRESGIYFFEDGPAGRPLVKFYSFAMGRVTTVLTPTAGPGSDRVGRTLFPARLVFLNAPPLQAAHGFAFEAARHPFRQRSAIPHLRSGC